MMSNKQIDKMFYKTIKRVLDKTGTVSLLSIINSQSKHRFKANFFLKNKSSNEK